ncbi:MAG: putative O-glycosylation ligase, exosortase A system-associated [Betaproteobacteria bacterium]|nr:putative O-glycosylation ligase, exosortase A system-associated [Betaproteobacteria bacterium]
MRDLFVACIVFGLLPVILKRPFIGILLSAWLGYLNPHRLCYGFMLSMPVVQIVAITTMVGMLMSNEVKRMIWSRETVVLAIFIGWMGVTTMLAFHPDPAWTQYEKVIKIQILTFMSLLLLTSKARIDALVWIIVLSLGFYGVKGGLFTILNGGAYRVQGPFGTFIGGNNELALALVMTIPLMRYLQLHSADARVRLGLLAGQFLTALAAIGSQSRGALVAITLTALMFWLKSRKKLGLGLLITVAAVTIVYLMPDAWYERMSTINTYEEDASALGRINAWWAAWNLANHEFFGGGFEVWRPLMFSMYAPDPANVRAPHSIYFQVLGEHGWVGFIIFMSLISLTWLRCSSLRRMGKRQPQLLWAGDLGAMVQVSLLGYMSAGAFLGLANFDYFYHLVAIVVAAHYLVTTPQAVTVDPAPQASQKLSLGTLWAQLRRI